MKIVLEKPVKDYLAKNNSSGVIIDMIPDRTSAGCGCGKTKKFYVPFIRTVGTVERPGKNYSKYEAEGINVYIADKALLTAKETVTVYIEKTFIISNLAVRGIEIYVPQEQ